MAGERTLDHAQGQRRAGAFAQAQAQRQERLLAQRRQQAAMRGLGADMAREAVIQRARNRARQHGGRGGADEPVQHHRNPLHPRPRDGPGHGGKLTPAQTAQHLQRVIAGMQRHARRHDLRLARQPRIIDAGAPPDPLRRIAAEQGTSQRCGGSGVADPHLPHHKCIRGGVHRVPARGEGRDHLGFGHGGALGEIGGGPVQIQRMHRHRCAKGPRQLVDRRPARAEVGHHLHGHFRRKGRTPLRHRAMIARKDDDLRAVEMRAVRALPPGEPDRHLLQPPKRPRRLGQLPVARLCPDPRRSIGCGHLRQDLAKGGKAGKGGGHGNPR